MTLNDWDDRFHQAAKDGNLDLLAKANRKDANTKDEDGMTPTIWAAYYGNLAALRKIIERGGKPDYCDHLGNTALHCAASRGHYNCVSYLINFGCNLWAMDNSHRTAMDLASLGDREDIVKLLDQARADEKNKNPKLVRKNQENAVAEADARIKEFDKLQKKLQNKMKLEESTTKRETISTTTAKPSGFYKTLTSKFQSTTKTSDQPRGAPTIMTSQTGEVLLRQPEAMSQKKIKKILAADDTNSVASDMTFRTDSGYGDDDRSSAFPIRSGLPGLSLNFMTKMRPLQAADLYGLSSARRTISEEEEYETTGNSVVSPRSDSAIDSVGSGASYAQREEWRELDLSEDEDEAQEEDLKLFLASNGLGKFYPLFQKEAVDMQTLLLLTETDLEKIGLELGPRKKLMHAILRFKADLEVDVPAEVSDSRL